MFKILSNQYELPKMNSLCITLSDHWSQCLQFTCAASLCGFYTGNELQALLKKLRPLTTNFVKKLKQPQHFYSAYFPNTWTKFSLLTLNWLYAPKSKHNALGLTNTNISVLAVQIQLCYSLLNKGSTISFIKHSYEYGIKY